MFPQKYIHYLKNEINHVILFSKKHLQLKNIIVTLRPIIIRRNQM